MTRSPKPTRPPKTNSSTPPESIREGDILFFAPPEETDDLEVFDQLAAFVQGAPWTHVAVAGSREDDLPWVIGFGLTGDQARSVNVWSATIDRFDWATATQGYAVTAWRHPHVDGTELSAAALRLKGKRYDTPGLLAFAAAAQARLFHHGDGRRRLHHFAKGVVAVSRDENTYTCVTAIGAALRAVGVRPPILDPALPPHDPDRLPEELTRSIEELFTRAGTATEGLGLPTEGIPILDETQVEEAWGVRVPGVGLIKTTTEYLALLGAVMSRMKQDPSIIPDYLVNRGCEEPAPGAVHATVSPAMLRDGLIRAGFFEVS